MIVEGFKSEGRIPRIEVRRSIVTDPPIHPQDPNVIAVATDFALDCPLPVLDLNDADKIVEFIMQRLARWPRLPAPMRRQLTGPSDAHR